MSDLDYVQGKILSQLLEDAALEMKGDERFMPAFKSEAKGGTGVNSSESKRTIVPGNNNQEVKQNPTDMISQGLKEGMHKQPA